MVHLKEAFMDAFDDNEDDKIEIAEVFIVIISIYNITPTGVIDTSYIWICFRNITW